MKLIGEYCLDDSRYRKAIYLFQSIALKRISPPSYTTLLILGLYSHPIPSHLLVTPIAILICRFFFWFVVFNLRLLDFMFIVLRQLPVLLQCCFISCHDFISSTPSFFNQCRDRLRHPSGTVKGQTIFQCSMGFFQWFWFESVDSSCMYLFWAFISAHLSPFMFLSRFICLHFRDRHLLFFSYHDLPLLDIMLMGNSCG